MLKRRGFYCGAKALYLPFPLALVLFASAALLALIGFIVLSVIGIIAAALLVIPVLLSRGSGARQRFENGGSTVVLKPGEYKVLKK